MYERSVNTDSILRYLNFYVTLGPETIFKDIYTLPPGSYIEVTESDPNNVTINKYWEVPKISNNSHLQQRLETFLFRLKKAMA